LEIRNFQFNRKGVNMKSLTVLLLMLALVSTPLTAQSWKYLNEDNSDLPTNAVMSIYFDDDESIWFCTQDSGLIHFKDGKYSAYNSASNDGFDADYVNAITKSAQGVYWIASEYHGLYKYADGQFTRFSDDGAGHDLKYLRSIALENGGPGSGGAVWIGTWGHGLFRFDGSHWNYYDQQSGILPDNSTLALAVEDDPNSTQSIVWVGTNNGLMKFDGKSWVNVSIGNSSNLWVNALALKNGGPSFAKGQLIAGCETGELALYDGTNWNIFNMADAWNPNNSVTDISVDADGIVWFGQDEEGLGMYDEKSLLSFYQDNSGIAGNNVICVATRQVNDSTEVWCSTYSNMQYQGLSIYTQASVTGLQKTDILPSRLSLEQNFPNPFNPATRIRFTLPKAGTVRLIVSNLRGQHVRTLLNRMVTSGSHELLFDGSDLPSGVYFYTLQSGKTRITRKMLLIR